jgi:hypothetical protein
MLVTAIDIFLVFGLYMNTVYDCYANETFKINHFYFFLLVWNAKRP